MIGYIVAAIINALLLNQVDVYQPQRCEPTNNGMTCTTELAGNRWS